MSAPVPYFDVVRQMKNAFDYRLRLVSHARQHGIKAAARAFQTTVPTVRKWLRRYEARKLSGLQELSRAPHSCPRFPVTAWNGCAGAVRDNTVSGSTISGGFALSGARATPTR